MFLGVRRATQPAVDFRGQLGATLGADVRPRRPVSRDLAAWRQMVAPQISLRRKGEARVARRVPGSQFEEGPRAHDRTVRRIEKRGALETAHRALGNCGQVFRCAIATGRAKRDPTGDLRGALPAVRPTHFAAITEPKAVGALMRAIDSYEGSLTVRSALRLAPLVFARPGELRRAEWTARADAAASGR